MFGWRKRIGYITPTVMELIPYEFYSFAKTLPTCKDGGKVTITLVSIARLSNLSSIGGDEHKTR